jgi:hypothetical protein
MERLVAISSENAIPSCDLDDYNCDLARLMLGVGLAFDV